MLFFRLTTLFCLSLLFATVNDPLRLSLFSGYRNDRLHWHLQEGGTGMLTYSELYRNLQFWENGLDLRFIHRDFALYLRGSYAAFGKGKLFQTYDDLSFTPVHPQFQFQTSGWASDGLISFSYAVNLTPERAYRVLLLPLVGFSAHFERIWSRDASPQRFSSDSFSLRSSLPNSLHLTWYGAFLGGAFNVAPGNALHLQAGYSYHWLNERFSTHLKELLTQGSTQESIRTSIHANGNGNIGQSGWGQTEYELGPWRLGLGAMVRYFSTTLLPAKVSTQTNSQEQKLKLRWTPISGWIIVSREI